MTSAHAATPLENNVKVFGFWIYLMTDLIVFAVLFAAFIVLRTSTMGAPTGAAIFHLPFALTQTLILLTSTFTCALAMISTHQKKKSLAISWFLLTFLFGAAFLVLEIYEFHDFVEKGASWKKSAYLSSFFALVGTHGLHIASGLLWMAVTMFRIGLRPLSPLNISKIFCMALFWHFLDFVWIFIFTIVYATEFLF
jgi:cytochrome o ubiquinol oxidase subunit 3